MKSVLVTGCNRGIGLGLVKHFAAAKIERIIATCRDPENARALCDVQKIREIHILKTEIRDADSVANLARSVGEIVKEDGLNVLINSAGISSKFARLQMTKESEMMENFRVNTVAPVMITKALHPLLKAYAKKNGSAIVVNISSIMGSIAENDIGGFYPYRASKAALNAVTKSMNIDLKGDGIVAVSLHPGWVKTDMGGAKAPMDVESSVQAIGEFISNVTSQHGGNFYNYDGKPLPF